MSPMGIGDSMKHEVRRAMEAFQSGNRGSAIQSLETIVEASKDPDARIALAQLYCLVQRELDAQTLLDGLDDCSQAEPVKALLYNHFHSVRALGDRRGLEVGSHIDWLERHADWKGPNLIGAKLSATLIVKNEEDCLERCLQSLAGKVDEIVVVDTGSSDRTIEIARSFGAVIGSFEWCDDFAAARNASLELSTGDWNLWIDADEKMDEEAWGPIWEAIVRPQFGGYFVPIVNFTDEEERCEYTHAPIRLFQNRSGIRFEGKIHEQISPSIEREGLPTATLDGARILHFGYKPSAMAAKNKVERTISMLERQVEEEPEDAFHWFNLANAYSVAARFTECVDAARTCLSSMTAGHNYASLTFQLLQGALNALGKPAEAIEAALDCKQNGSWSILNQFELAHSYFLNRDFDRALIAIDACQAMPWNDGMTGDKAIVTHKADTLKGKILTELGRAEEAIEVLKRSLNVDPNFGLSIAAMARAHERNANLEIAFEWYQRAIQHPSVAFESLKGAARCKYESGRFEEARSFAEAALAAAPDDREAWSLTTQACEGLKDRTACVSLYEDFVGRHGPHADVLVNWSRALLEFGDQEAALEKLVSAIDVDPTNCNAILNLADLLYTNERFVEAVELYSSALRLEPGNPEAWFCLGNATARMGGWLAAKGAFEQALTLDPTHVGALNNLEVALVEVGAAA